MQRSKIFYLPVETPSAADARVQRSNVNGPLRGSITVRLTSCLFSLDLAALLMLI